MVIIDWIKKVIGIAPVVAVEIQPVVADGTAIVGDLTELIADLKAGRYLEVIADANQSLADVKVFVAEVEKVVTALQAANK
jgi:hypothetical protein